jgi:hypothetical protein
MTENRFHMADYKELAFVKQILNMHESDIPKNRDMANVILDDIMSKQDNSPEMRKYENKSCVECGSRYLDYCRCGGKGCGPDSCRNCGEGAVWEEV